MTTLPLHKPVTIACLCCGHPFRITLRSQTDLRICDRCKSHQGPRKAEQRESAHRKWWSEAFAHMQQERRQVEADKHVEHREMRERLLSITAENDSEIANLIAEVDFVSRGNRSADSEARIESEELRDAIDQRNSAYRSRDRAYGALWLALEVHHSGNDGLNCSCGLKVNKCEVWDAVASIAPTIWKWERDQIERLHSERPHGLPDEHPEVVKSGRDSYWVRTHFGHQY